MQIITKGWWRSWLARRSHSYLSYPEVESSSLSQPIGTFFNSSVQFCCQLVWLSFVFIYADTFVLLLFFRNPGRGSPYLPSSRWIITTALWALSLLLFFLFDIASSSDSIVHSKELTPGTTDGDWLTKLGMHDSSARPGLRITLRGISWTPKSIGSYDAYPYPAQLQAAASWVGSGLVDHTSKA
jgi:hypothetical protein